MDKFWIVDDFEGVLEADVLENNPGNYKVRVKNRRDERYVSNVFTDLNAAKIVAISILKRRRIHVERMLNNIDAKIAEIDTM